MKMKRPNTLDSPVPNMDMTDSIKAKVPFSVKVCNRFGTMCQFCKQSAPHPSLQESDWMDGDWTGEQTKTQKSVGETNLMSDWDLPSPQYNPNSEPVEIDKINIDKLSLDLDYPQEELVEIPNSLIPPPTTEEVEKTTTQEKTDLGTDSNQQEGEDYED